MADDSTDTAFGFILFMLFLALLGYAAGGGGWPSSTAGTTRPRIRPYLHHHTGHLYVDVAGPTTNIPGGTTPELPGQGGREQDSAQQRRQRQPQGLLQPRAQ